MLLLVKSEGEFETRRLGTEEKEGDKIPATDDCPPLVVNITNSFSGVIVMVRFTQTDDPPARNDEKVSELRVRIKRTESVSTRAMFYDQMTIGRERDGGVG